MSEDQIRLCGGTCGRLTRPKGAPPVEGMHTMARSDGTYCAGCYNRYAPAAIALKERDAAAKAKRDAERKVEQERRQEAAFREKERLLAARQERQAVAARRELAALLIRQQHRRARASA